MKKILITLIVIVLGAGIIMWLSNGSQEYTSGASQDVEKPADDGSRYVDPSGFSFEKLPGYSIRTIPEGASKTILFEKGGIAGTGFQIFVSYYDEPAAEFTAARIKKDLPDIAMKNVKGFEIEGGRGVMFDLDSNREIWFVSGESLYQVTAPLSEADPAEHVVTTFKAE